ncbi:MAG TPA: LysR family transcriptional regulator, partial [Ktedonobacteraceae bacterium]
MDNVVDLRRLYYFMIVAEELHFTHAAERLHMAQPPLSYHIQQLERELGVQLFERSRRSVQLTDAGHVLLSEARRIFGQMEQNIRVVQRVGHGEVGLLNLGFVPSASNTILPLCLHLFHQRFPDVQLSLKELNPDQLVSELHERHIDVGFLYLPLSDDDLNTRPVQHEPLLVALPLEHPLANQQEITLQSLTDDPFIIPPRYTWVPGLRSHIIEACRLAGFVPKIAQEAWLMQTIIGLVAANMGVALVPASVQNLHRTGVVYKTLHDRSIEVNMGVIWRRNEIVPVVQHFLQVTTE